MSIPATGRPTIYDVAERAGVSKSLVSLVLQNAPHVSEKRRQAVLRAIAELDYRPSSAAAALAGNRTHSVGLAIDHFENLWFLDLLTGMREVLDAAALDVVLSDRHLHLGREIDPVRGFLSMQVEALVLAMEPPADLPDLGSVPVVVAGTRGIEVPGADVVANDDAAGGRLATRHLLDLGHTVVAHLTGGGGAAAARRTAYEATMRRARRQPLVFGEGETTEEDGYVAARAALDQHPEVTGIFAANDLMALGALAALRERGLRVPEQVSVIGYDDSPLAASRFLSLTTVDDRSVDIGRSVAERLLARREEPQRATTRTLLPPRLVLRASTAPPARC